MIRQSEGGPVNGLAFSRDGTILATGDATGTICLWRMAGHRSVLTLTEPASRALQAVAISPDGRLLAAADLNGKAYVWRLSPAA